MKSLIFAILIAFSSPLFADSKPTSGKMNEEVNSLNKNIPAQDVINSGHMSRGLASEGGSLFCHNGFIYNSNGQKVLNESIPGCRRMISGSLFCHNGFVHNSDGQKVLNESIPGCRNMINGSLFCHNGFIYNSNGQKVLNESIPGCRDMIGVIRKYRDTHSIGK